MSTPPTLPALLLAAGLSTRMQAFKPLILLSGKPLLHHAIDALLNSRAIDPIFIVTGHNAKQIEASLAAYSHPSTANVHTLLHPIFNPHYAAGEMLSSLLIGLAALPPNAPAFLLAFADQPAVSPTTIHALVERFHTPPQSPESPHPPLVLPTYSSKRGHPILISTTLLPEIQSLPPTDTLKTIVHRHLQNAALLPTNDPSILEDLDTPEDLARAQQRLSQQPHGNA